MARYQDIVVVMNDSHLAKRYGKSKVYYRIKEDYLRMRRWLPEKVKSIIEIGCGPVPLLPLWLCRHYGGQITFHLIDGDEVSKRKFKNYVENSQPWKSRNPAVLVLSETFPMARVIGHSPDPGLDLKADLVVSRRAWGHHFAIRQYIDMVHRALPKGGRVITDIRIGTDGLECFAEYGFEVLSDDLEVRSMKSKRYVLEKT